MAESLETSAINSLDSLERIQDVHGSQLQKFERESLHFCDEIEEKERENKILRDQIEEEKENIGKSEKNYNEVTKASTRLILGCKLFIDVIIPHQCVQFIKCHFYRERKGHGPTNKNESADETKKTREWSALSGERDQLTSVTS